MGEGKMKKHFLFLICFLLFVFGCAKQSSGTNSSISLNRLDGSTWVPVLIGGLFGDSAGLTFSGNKFKLNAVGVGIIGTYEISDEKIIFLSDKGDFTGEFFDKDSIWIDIGDGTKFEFIRKGKK
jgi:hypothetical protein